MIHFFCGALHLHKCMSHPAPLPHSKTLQAGSRWHRVWSGTVYGTTGCPKIMHHFNLLSMCAEIAFFFTLLKHIASIQRVENTMFIQTVNINMPGGSVW